MSKPKLVEVKKKFYQELYPDSVANQHRCGYTNLVGVFAMLFVYGMSDAQKEQQLLGILAFLQKRTAFFDCPRTELKERYGMSHVTRWRYKKWLGEGKVDVEITRKTLKRVLECCLRVRGFREMFWYEFLRTLCPKLFLCLETREEPTKSDPQAFLIKEYEDGRAAPIIRVSRLHFYQLLKELLDNQEVSIGSKDYPGYSSVEALAGLCNLVEATQADGSGEAFRKGKAVLGIG